MTEDVTTMIPVARIIPGDNHRTEFDPDELAQLGESIRTVGQFTPVIVRPHGDGFQLVAGERRWRAHQLIGKPEIKATIKSDLTHEDVENIMMAENTGRVDLGLMDEANAYDRQRRMGKSVDEIAAAAGVARFRVEWRLSLIDRLCPEAQQAVAAGAIPPAAALEIRDLDSDRQRLAVKAWCANPGMGAVAFKRRIVAKLLDDQNSPEQFGLFADWEAEARSVQPVKHTVAGLQRVMRLMAAELVQRGYPPDGELVADVDWSTPNEQPIEVDAEGRPVDWDSWGPGRKAGWTRRNRLANP